MVDHLTGFENTQAFVKWTNSMSPNFKVLGVALRQVVIDITNNVAELVEQILPVALPVLGIAIAVFFGVKFIKKVMR